MAYRYELEGADVEFKIPPPPGFEAVPTQQVKSIFTADTPQATIKAMSAERAFQPVEGIVVHKCICQRCPKVWITLLPHKPKTCPSCHSAWWDQPRTPNLNPPREVKPKKKGKAGRPRKNVIKKVGTKGTTSIPVLSPEEVYADPVEVLGTMGELTDVSIGAGFGIPSTSDEEDFPVATPYNNRIPLQTVHSEQGHPQVELGQPINDGGSEITPTEELPQVMVDEDDDWERFG